MEPPKSESGKDIRSYSLRCDFRSIQKIYNDRRSADRLIAHYAIETVLAEKLRRSSPESRNRTYREVYGELLAKVIDHPRHTRANDKRRTDITKLVRLVTRFMSPKEQVLEIGAGDAELSRRICELGHNVVAVDVDDTFISTQTDFHYLLSDGVSLPLPDQTISFAISHQLLEHIHPDDTQAHLSEVFRILDVGGRYLVMTPNRVSGPHDVSRYFDHQARGTHLREFDAKMIRDCLRAVGFKRFEFYATRGGYIFFSMPYWMAHAFDRLFSLVPSTLHTAIVRNKATRTVLGLTVVAYK